MTLELWTAFALACLVLALVPGPGVASIIGFAFSSGRRTALASVGGMAIGNFLAISISLAGAGVLLATSAIAFTVLKWIGALYLIALGILAIRKGAAPPDLAVDRTPIGPRTAFLCNVAVGLFHPKTILFFVAFASQFVDPRAPYLPQAAILVMTFTLIAAITDTGYALAASRASALMRNPRTLRWANRAGGGILIAAGVATAAMRR